MCLPYTCRTGTSSERVPISTATVKRTYNCQRCLNHGVDNKRRNHKANCPFSDCDCTPCQMVDKRRQINCKLNVMVVDQQQISSQASLSKERKPNCQRCAQHGSQARLKGHKKACPFKTCDCHRCVLVMQRQQLMADQIKLRRKQKKQKEAVDRPHLPPPPNTLHHNLGNESSSTLCRGPLPRPTLSQLAPLGLSQMPTMPLPSSWSWTESPTDAYPPLHYVRAFFAPPAFASDVFLPRPSAVALPRSHDNVSHLRNGRIRPPFNLDSIAPHLLK